MNVILKSLAVILMLSCFACTSPTSFLHDEHRVALGLRDDQIKGFQFYINHHTVLFRIIESADGQTGDAVKPAKPDEVPAPAESAEPGEAKPCDASEVDDAGKPEVRDSASEATPEATPNATPDATPNTTPDATPNTTPDATPNATPETPSEVPAEVPAEVPPAAPQDQENVEEIVIRKNTPCVVVEVGPKTISVTFDKSGHTLTFKTRTGWGKSLPTYDGYGLEAEKKDGANFVQFKGKTYQVRTEPEDAWPSLAIDQKSLDDLIRASTLGGRKVGN